MALHTPRLHLRQLQREDAGFIQQLLNEPGWLRFIGNRNITNALAAEKYIQESVNAQFLREGYGLYAVCLGADGLPMGLCGLVRRASLPAPDLGFALLERYQGAGYLFEAAQAVLAHESQRFGFSEVLAITHPDNAASQKLLLKLNFLQYREAALVGETEPLHWFRWQAAACG